jgi:DNA polymerase II large subunit
MRPEDERYFERVEEQLDDAFDVATAAKERGGDPDPDVEIPVARDMADRVENILGIDGVAERVRDLEGEISREEAALELAADFAEGRVGDYETRAGKVEGAVRTAVALLTEGVVAAPIEGIDRVELLENDDGTEFVNVYYAGPIRSAGGTAQALSVLVADYTRALLDVEEYRARDDEIERYAEEVTLYDKETGLQYTPKDEETRFIAEHMPIMLDGEATGDEEVSGFRDLDRVDTNAARGGMCLVLAEGIALKAPKIQRYTRQLDEVDWPWLQDLIDGTIGDGESEDDADDTPDDAESEETSDAVAGPPRADPTEKYLRDLIAGRPVFGHPSREGGFRLRYGRARNHGFATAGVHPATMHLVDDFLATGTQIKTERPGKAAGVVPVDSIEGPTVKLANGEVRRIDDPEEALEVRNGVEAILDLGEYLVNYGEFVENNHPLAPASYTVEWWVQDLEAAGADVRALRDDPHVDLADPAAGEALTWASDYDAPLHPKYTYLWHDLPVDAFERLAETVASEGRLGGDADRDPDGREDGTADAGRMSADGSGAATLTVPATDPVCDALEALLVEHRRDEEIVTVPDARPLVRTLGLTDDLERTWTAADLSAEAREYGGGDSAMRAVEAVAPFAVRERAPTRIGNRMGRPEKSESREMSPTVHTLFPIGEAGGSQRDVSAAANHTESMRGEAGQVEVEVARRECEDCGRRTFKAHCPECEGRTWAAYECWQCGAAVDPDESGRAECPRCERKAEAIERQVVDVAGEYRQALANVGERPNAFEILKGVKGLSSTHKIPEPIEKGILRAKHGVSSFKDGTVRYDMTDLPVTAVRPEELAVSADHLRELGYETDVDGEPLRHDDQLVELRVQDVVLSEGAADHMLKTADFVDALLEQYYGMKPFYDVEERDDLVGELVFGMAPHTSAAVVGRVVGFTSAAVGYAHPYFHAAKRRNCFHPETKVWIEDGSGSQQFRRIGEVVEKRLDDPDVDDFGAAVQELEAEVRVPAVDGDGNRTTRPVDAVSKHPAPDHLVEVTTRSGCELRVTPDHDLVRWNDGPEKVAANEIEAGDAVPTPKAVEYAGEQVRLDLLEEFLHVEAVPNESLTIRGLGSDRIRSLLNEATPGDGYLRPTAELLDCSDSTVYDLVDRDSIPVSVLETVLGEAELLERVPTDVRLSVERDTAAVDRVLEIDEQFAELLGYYAAEGFTRREEGNFYRTTIRIPDAGPRSKIEETFQRHLGVDAFEENEWKVTVSSRLVAALFDDVLEAGAGADRKRIPPTVFESPKPSVRAFLRAYFDGDGSASSDRGEIRAHTVSDELKRDLVAALKRFGIATKACSETRRPETGAVVEFYGGETPEFTTWVLKITSENAVGFRDRVGFSLDRKQDALEAAIEGTPVRTRRLLGDGGDVWLDEVVDVEIVESDVDHTYCLTVEETHTLVANDLFVGQCDGDEDCVMLLMDGLLNFSKSYLPDQRGGRMDAPLVMSSRIDPTEIDDEAHNMDVVREYPREFYEATREMVDPEAVEDLVPIAEANLDTDREYTGFDHTHDTSDIALGPDLSAYKTLGSMMNKMDAQLDLARKLRAVDETDVAERVIEYHFLPDLIGNLRAFSRQETRCLDCGAKYRRMPLTGECRECGGRVNLTVHEGSVNKYMQMAIQVAEEFGCRNYTKQRLEVLERSLESVFEDDTNKQSGIADFM